MGRFVLRQFVLSTSLYFNLVHLSLTKSPAELKCFFRLKLEDGQPRLMALESQVSKLFSLTGAESSFMLLLDYSTKL